jgi:hypothetical protein
MRAEGRMREIQKFNDLTFFGYYGSTDIIISEYRNPSVTFKINIDRNDIPIIIEILKTYIPQKTK